MPSPFDYLTRPQIMAESGGDPNAVSPKGATGIMQVMPATARDPGFGLPNIFDLARQMGKRVPGNDPVTLQNLLRDPEVNQAFGVAYRDAMIQNRGGNVAEGLAAYNAGPGAVDRAGGVPNFPETQNYVARLMGDAQQPQPQGQPSQPPAMMQAQAAPMPGMAQGGPEQAAPQGETPFWQSDKFGNILDSLAIGVNSLRMTPDANIAQAAQGRMAERKGKAATNKTVEFLRAQGRTDLADAVESGSLDAKSAVGIIYAKGGDGTGLQKEYAAAQGQGFGGTLLDYQQEVSNRTRAPKDATGAPTVTTLTTEDGSQVAVQWDREAGSWVPLAAPAGAIPIRKPLTEGQGKIALFQTMQEQTSPVLDRMEEKFNPANVPDAIARNTPIAGNFFTSSQGQVYNASAEAWAEGALRIATGAAATPDEKNAVRNTYFAQPGDTPVTIEFKRGLRRSYEEAIRKSQGRGTGYQLPIPADFAAGAPGGGADTPIPEGGYPVKRVIP
jgi:hypothetical protein